MYQRLSFRRCWTDLSSTLDEMSLEDWHNTLRSRRPLSFYEQNWDRGDVQDEAIAAGIEIGELMYSLPLHKLLRINFTFKEYKRACQLKSKIAEEIGLRAGDRESVVCIALKYEHRRVLQRFIDSGLATPGILANAAWFGTRESVRMLLDAGVRSSNALLWACRHGRIEIVRMLLDAGIHCNDALSAACSTGQVEVVRLLLDRGIRDDEASFTAECHEHWEVVDLLKTYT